MGGGNLDTKALLQSHAEVAVALAGFASGIGTLGRPLSSSAHQRFLLLPALALIQVSGCPLPLWFLHQMVSPSAGWRFLSLVLLGLNVARMWWLVILPVRAPGDETRSILDPAVTKFTYGAGLLGFAPLGLDTIGIGFRPNLDLYFAGLPATPLVGFALFAHVATRES